MRHAAPMVPLLLLALAAPGPAREMRNPRKPRLDLRASPRVAYPPASVVVVAELVGGDEVEDFYCPELVWEWGDGNRSAHEADCPPFEPGMELSRRFVERHVYRQRGEHTVRVTLRHAGQSVAAASTRVTVGGELSAITSY